MSVCWTKKGRCTKLVCPLKKMSADPRHFPGNCKSVVLFKPLALLLRFSGMMYNTDALCDPSTCFCRNDGDGHKVVPTAKPRRRLRKWTRIAYMAVVLSLPWSIVIKILFCFNKLTLSLFEVSSQLHIIILLTVISSSFAQTATTIEFSSRLSDLPKKLCFIKMKYSIKKEWSLKTVASLGTLISLVPVFLAAGACAVTTLAPSLQWLLESYAVIVICPYDVDLNPFWNVILVTWFALSIGLAVTSVIFCMSFFVWFCKVVSSLFDECSRRLRQLNADQSLGKSRLLLTVVEFHRDICELLDLGNGMFKYFVLAIYCMTIPTTCLNVNVIFNSKMGSPTWINAVWEEAFMMILILTVVLSASGLSTKAAQICGDLYQLSVKDATNEDLQLASFFSTKLADSEVGITVVDMFVINKGHILTLLSILVTYTVLIVQFDPSSISHLTNNATTV